MSPLIEDRTEVKSGPFLRVHRGYTGHNSTGIVQPAGSHCSTVLTIRMKNSTLRLAWEPSEFRAANVQTENSSLSHGAALPDPANT